jgi:hypothetical protein
VSYGAAVARLAPGVVHLVAVAKIPGLMPNLSEDHLWAELSGPRYTTPLLRSWIPWLKQAMVGSGGIVVAQGMASTVGARLTVKIPASAAGKGLAVRIGCHTDENWQSDEWLRMPAISPAKQNPNGSSRSRRGAHAAKALEIARSCSIICVATCPTVPAVDGSLTMAVQIPAVMMFSPCTSPGRKSVRTPMTGLFFALA